MLLHWLAACATPEDTGAPVASPESVVATAHDGDPVSFVGQVFTLTYDSGAYDGTSEDPGDDDGVAWQLHADRWLLMRTDASSPPAGVTHGELTADEVTDEATIALGWGLGVHLTAGDLAPQNGATLSVSGTYTLGAWNGHTLPMVENATWELVDGVVLGTEGSTCARDADCEDHLVCLRDTGTCETTPGEINWGSAWHDVMGACDTDDDCPRGQHCDADYAIPAAGEYAPGSGGHDDPGRFLCVLDAPDDLEGSCGAVHSTQDLAGGRWIQGREICIEGSMHLLAAASDGDTHAQMVVDEPLPFPKMDAHVWLFGATTENVPPYKDPARAAGALIDPALGERVVAIGTYRYDEGHGWFEMHPVKAYWPLD